MNFHLLQGSSLPDKFSGPLSLVVANRGAEATREALRLATEVDSVTHVIGWVDISSPNLVDLIEDLAAGPGGDKLTGLRLTRLEATVDAVPLQRGVSTVESHNLTLWLDPNDTVSNYPGLDEGAVQRLRQLP